MKGENKQQQCQLRVQSSEEVKNIYVCSYTYQTAQEAAVTLLRS